MKIFIQDSNQRAARKLSQINLTAGTARVVQTCHQDICHLLKTEIKKPAHMLTYLDIMKKVQFSSQNMLKYCIFLHCYTQYNKIIHNDQLNHFLKHLLDHVPILMEKYSSKEIKNDKKTIKLLQINPLSRSFEQKSLQASTRSQQIFICKQIFLAKHVIVPYISYLMKRFSSHSQYLEITNKKMRIEKHQAWMLINNLKIICSITSPFITIGRYFMTFYGGLIVLLIKSLSKDISRMMDCISDFIQFQKEEIFADKENGGAGQCDAGQLIHILQEISTINDELFKVYIGKYFVNYIRDIPRPRWVIPQSKQFDELYNLGSKEKNTAARKIRLNKAREKKMKNKSFKNPS